MFFKRRSRSNSYIDNDPPQRQRSQSYDKDSYDKFDRPESSQHNTQPFTNTASTEEDDMYNRQPGPQDAYGSQRGINGGHAGHNSLPVSNGSTLVSPAAVVPSKHEPAPDALTRAFNEAVRPYSEKIDNLENQLADLQDYVASLEAEKKEMYAWIDQRGLRPDVPASIARAMDDPSSSASATSLSTQLDRKITIVNFDLHRLQDDLNSSLSTSHFAAAMLKFLPDISRLASLPTGPRLAFDLLLKLGGNLNAHGGLDSGDPEDKLSRTDFYSRLDRAMMDVVQGRFNEGEEWPVGREIKRIEKTAQYLKNFGIEPYFPATLDLMRREEGSGSMGQQTAGSRTSIGNLGGQGHQHSPTTGTPPSRYH